MRTTCRRALAVAAAGASLVIGASGVALASLQPAGVTVTRVSVPVLSRDETTPATVTGAGFTAGTTASAGPGVTVTVTAVSPGSLHVLLAADDTAATGPRTLRVEVPHHAPVALARAFRVGFAPVLVRWAVGDGAVGFATSLVRPTFTAVPRVAVAGTGVRVTPSLGAGGVLDVSMSVSPDAAIGWRALEITAGAARFVVADGVKVRAAPQITSVTPLGQGEQGVTVRVVGRDFEVCKDQPMLVVGAPGVHVNWVSSALGTLLYANLSVAPGTPVGPRSVTLTNCDSGGRGTAPQGFSVLGAPQVGSVQPVAVGASRVVLVRGTNLTPATTLSASGTGVTFADVAYLSPTRLRATVTAVVGATLGPRSVTATDSGGLQSTTADALTIDAPPTTSSLAPAGIGANRDTLVTIHGTGFEPGAVVRVLQSGHPDPGVRVSPTKLLSASALEVLVAGSPHLGLGQDSLVVLNPDGGASGGMTFVTDPAPVLTSVAPSATTAGAIVVRFAAPAGAPGGEAYSMLACTNAALTAGCRTHALGAPGTSVVTGLAPGTRYDVAVVAGATTGFVGSRSSVAATLATLQLGPVTKVAAVPSVRVVGAIVVRFAGAGGAPAHQRYVAQACRDTAMTIGCVSAAISSGGAVHGLVPGARYCVRVLALASPGYLAARSAVTGAVPATLQLTAPVVEHATLRAGTLRVTFTGPAVHPHGQRWALRACANAAMTQGCVAVKPFVSGGAASFAGTTCFVEVTALASPGYLAATSKVVRAA